MKNSRFNKKLGLVCKYFNIWIFLGIIGSVCCVNIFEVCRNYEDGIKIENVDDVRALIKEFDTEVSDVETIKYWSININGAFQRLINKHYMYDVSRGNDLIRTEENYLVAANSAPGFEEGVYSSALQLKQTKEFCEENRITFLYVQAAGKNALSDDELIEGNHNYTYDKVEAFLEGIAINDIDYIDSRKCKKGGRFEDYFHTDHHWTIETALSITGDICRKLFEEGYLIDEKYYSETSFSVTTYENTFLGAEGRRTGIFYSGLDDISKIVPKYNTLFSVEIPSKNIKRTGDFSTTVIDESKKCEEYSFTDSSYYMYWGGDYPLVNIKNELCENDYKALIVKDSFGIPVSAFLTCCVSETTIVDLRYYQDTTLRVLIENEEPDMVIFVYGTGYLTNPTLFSLETY